MENELFKKAEMLEEKGFKEKAEMLRSISKSYTSSYKYDRFLDAISDRKSVVWGKSVWRV